MSAVVKVAVADLPTTIRDSVAAVLTSHGVVITRTLTPGGVMYPLRDMELAALLREIGNNAAQVVAACDLTEED